MSQRTKIALLLLVLCASVAGAGLLAGKVSGTQPRQPAPSEAAQDPFARLNDKARGARSNSEAAVRDMIDESFNLVALNAGPAGMADAVKERLVRAEMNWRAGATAGVSDDAVTRAVNHLADQFKALDYAHTSRYKLRLMHTALLPYMPDFIGQVNTGGRRNRGARTVINHENMSPVEAAFLTAMLLRQKQTNPDYQLTRAERINKWKELHGFAKKTKADKDSDAARAREFERRSDAVSSATRAAAATMSPVELLNVPSRVLDDLGVEQ